MLRVSVSQRTKDLGFDFNYRDRIKIGMVSSNIHYDTYGSSPKKNHSDVDGREVNVYPIHVVDEAIGIVRDRYEDWKRQRKEKNGTPKTYERVQSKLSSAESLDQLSAINSVIAQNNTTIESYRLKIAELTEENEQLRLRRGDKLPTDLLADSPFSSEETSLIRTWLSEPRRVPNLHIGVPCVISRETPDALLCLYERVTFWIPKSQVTVVERGIQNGCMTAKIDVPLWLVQRHQLPIKFRPFHESWNSANCGILNNQSANADDVISSQRQVSGSVAPVLPPSRLISPSILAPDWYEQEKEKKKDFALKAENQPMPEKGMFAIEQTSKKRFLIYECLPKNVIILSDGRSLSKRSDLAWREVGEKSSETSSFLIEKGILETIVELNEMWDEFESVEGKVCK